MTAAAARAALVTGGTGRLGRAVAEGLAARGFAVAVHCHASLPAARELAAALGGSSLAVTADLREEGAVRALVHRVIDHFGRLDAVVHCARRRTATALEEATCADLRIPFDVAVGGGFVVAQEAAAEMTRQETGGVIVFVVDATAREPRPGGIADATSQAAVAGLARGLAVDLAARSPRVRVELVEAAADDPAAAATAIVALVP